MNDIFQYILIGSYFIIPLGVFALIINIIYRKIKGKSMFTSGTTFVGENMFMLWETMSKKKAVEEIQYERDEKREDEDSGDPPEPGRENNGKT